MDSIDRKVLVHDDYENCKSGYVFVRDYSFDENHGGTLVRHFCKEKACLSLLKSMIEKAYHGTLEEAYIASLKARFLSGSHVLLDGIWSAKESAAEIPENHICFLSLTYG